MASYDIDRLDKHIRGWVNVMTYGADASGVGDSTEAIQRALGTGKHVLAPSGATFKISDSLYMATAGQEFGGGATISMTASLGKPCLWLGATDSSGTLPAGPIVNMKVRGLRFSGSGGASGTKTIGSAGIAFGKATTTLLESIYAWYFYAGIDVRGTSIANTLLAPDLRYNVYGVKDDRQTTAAGPDLQGSCFVGGRIEANQKEGVLTGSPNIAFIGTVIEGNAGVTNGGGGTDPEVRITEGYSSGGAVNFTNCYMETLSANTGTAMIRVDSDAHRNVIVTGGTYIAAGASTRYVIESLSASTVQSYSIVGGFFYSFRNYVKATIVNNSFVHVANAWSDATRTLTDDVSASAGASTLQIDRTQFLTSLSPSAAKYTATAPSGEIGVQLASGARLDLGSSKQAWTDGTNIHVGASGNVYLGGGTGTAFTSAIKHGGTGSISIAGTATDGATAVAAKTVSASALTTDGAEIHAFYADNGVTKKAAINALGGIRLGAPTAAWTLNAIYSGSGAPNDSYGANGDAYFRTDTPGIANQRLYVRAAGAWAGIL
jgi:hypothetical protein